MSTASPAGQLRPQTQVLRRIGMFGGAFDPPHLAHVAIARSALEQFKLDVLLVFPTGQAWHRAAANSEPGHRLSMARLAFAGLDRVQVDDAEIRRAGPTYSVDTLRDLRRSHPDAELFLVLGADQAQHLSRWQRWQDLLALASLCVVDRESESAPVSADAAASQAKAQGRWQELRLPRMQVSATEVRRRAALREDISGLVPASVARYIAEQKLYQANR